MPLVKHGTVQDGRVMLQEPVDLPEGTRVVVTIEPVKTLEQRVPTSEEIKEFRAEPFHGMWADREEMDDSAAWVRRIREQWRPST